MPSNHVSSRRRTQLAAAFSEIDEIFQDSARNTPIPGLAYGIVADGELVHSGSAGFAQVDPPVSAHVGSAFRIASMTKSFAALAIVMLRDAGLLALDDPAASYVPQLANLTYLTHDAAPITVRQLLTMAAGWPEDNAWGDRQMVLSDDAFTDLLRTDTAFANVPGVAYEYSNYGYMVLGRIIRNVSGLPCLDFITQRILQPLGMMDTCWNAEDVTAERLGLGYRWQDDAWCVEPELCSGGDVAAFAGLYSTVPDLVRWVTFFLSAWPPRDEADTAIVRRSSLREMQQVWRMSPPQVSFPAPGAPVTVQAGGYGYGLFVSHNGRDQIVGHSGGLPGFGSNMCWAPDYGIGVVALANATYAPMNQVGSEVLALLLRQPGVEPRACDPAPALAKARLGVIQLLDEWDDALADRMFASNFFLDEERSRWRDRLHVLRAERGVLRPDGPFEVENRLRGAWKMAGEQGGCRIWISLSPLFPPLIQSMTIYDWLPAQPA